MRSYRQIGIHSCVLFLLVTVFGVNAVNSQTPTDKLNPEVAKAEVSSRPANAGAHAPIFTNYRAVRIGMSADEVRKALEHQKGKGKTQDFFVFSESEHAQVFYDAEGRVTAISVDYIGNTSNAPTAQDVLGVELQAKPDGSMYEMKRYAEAGYWVSYNRTAGDNPIVTVTMQKL